MLVLLIIFMVTAPMLATGIKVNLPSAKTAQPLETKQPVVVVVARDGALSVGKDPVSRDELAAKVKAKLGDSNGVVQLRGDRDASYGDVVSVMDELAANGVTRIAIVSGPRRTVSPTSVGAKRADAVTAAALDARVFEPPRVSPPWLRPVIVVLVVALHIAALSIVSLAPKPLEAPGEVIVDIQPEASPAETPAPAAEEPKPPEKSAGEPSPTPPQDVAPPPAEPPSALTPPPPVVEQPPLPPPETPPPVAEQPPRPRLTSNLRCRRRSLRRRPEQLPPPPVEQLPSPAGGPPPPPSSLRRLPRRSRPRGPSLLHPCAPKRRSPSRDRRRSRPPRLDRLRRSLRPLPLPLRRRAALLRRARLRAPRLAPRRCRAIFRGGERRDPQSPLLSARRTRSGREGGCGRSLRHRSRPAR